MSPRYQYTCPLGCEEERYLTLSQHNFSQCCTTHGAVMGQRITAPLLVKAAPVVHYDSPIDGRPITSMQARREDLKRSGCRPYDEGQKQDYDRRIKEADAALDRDIEATVEEAVNKMDGRTRAKLASELLDQGTTADVIRSTPHV